MSRLRRYFVPALLLVPVIFVCGRLLLTPVQRPADYAEELSLIGFPTEIAERYPFGAFTIVEQGWPWVFRTSYSLREDSERVIDFSVWRLFANLVVLLAAVSLTGWMIARHRRRRQKWLQLSLREALALTAICAVAFAWWFDERNQFQREQPLRQSPDEFWFSTKTAYCGPAWLRRLVPGIEENNTIFDRVFVIEEKVPSRLPPQPDRISDLLLPYRDFHKLQAFSISTKLSMTVGGDRSEEKPPHDLSSFDKLEFVNLFWYGDDDTLAEVATLPHIRYLWCSGRPIGDAGLAHLANCRTLEALSVEDGIITDAGIQQLEKLTRLAKLKIDRAEISDAAVETLLKLRELRKLDLVLWEKPLSDNSVRKLLELPHLREFKVGPVSDEAWELVNDFNERLRDSN